MKLILHYLEIIYCRVHSIDNVLRSFTLGCKILIESSTESYCVLNDLNWTGGPRWLLTDLAMSYVIRVSYSLKCIVKYLMFVTKCYRNGAGLVTLIHSYCFDILLYMLTNGVLALTLLTQ